MRTNYRSALYKVGCFSLYIVLLFMFVSLLVNSGRFSEQIQELTNLSNLFTVKIERLLIVISMLFTLVAMFIEYGIALFLITLFFDENSRNFGDVCLSKSISLFINILLFILLKPSNEIFVYTNLITVFLIAMTNYYRFNHLKLSLTFALPFLFNSVISIINSR